VNPVETELARLSIGLISEPKVAVTRTFLAEVLAKLVELKAEAAARKTCDCCEERPAYQIPERDDGAHAPRIFASIARFNAVGAPQ